MKYLLCYSLPGLVARYHDDVVADISRQFGTQQLNQRIDPHVTLKAPFDADKHQIEEVERIVTDFTTSHTPTSLTIDGFGHFKERIIYMDVVPGSDTKELIAHFTNTLETRLPWMPFHEYDIHKDLHATIVKRDVGERFDEMWRYVNNTYRPLFHIELDNITILENRDKRWYTHKTFPLQQRK